MTSDPHPPTSHLRPPGVDAAGHLVVVLPVYNEADSIAAVLGEVLEAAERLRLAGVRTTAVLVDDESPDGTAAVARAFADAVSLPLDIVGGVKAGLGRAMLRGLRHALTLGADAIVTLDGDGQHNPTDIPTLYRAFTARNADIVIGSRWTRGGRAPGMTTGRVLGSRAGNVVFRLVTGTRGVRDATTSFRVYSPRVARFLLDTPSERYTGYSFFSTTVALAEAAGYAISEVPIEFRPRFGGQSKLNRAEVRRYFASLPELRGERRRYAGGGPDRPYLATAELEYLRRAERWNRFVVDAAVLGVPSESVRHVVEVGAGLGNVTDVLLDRFPLAAITAIEPDAGHHRDLMARFAGEPRVTAHHGALADVAADRVPAGGADLVVYVSVLEHVEHDEAELAGAARAVRRGGTLAIFVPAMPSLYGPIDARSGHHRRYTSAQLASLVRAAGFDPVRVAHADRLGIAPYWLNYRVLNKAGMPSGPVWFFDRVFVPATGMVDRLLARLPFGKNVVCTAVKR